MNRYSEYKESGVEWLGEVPGHWQVKRLKDIGNLVLGKMLDNVESPQKYLKPYLKSKNIGWFQVDLNAVEEMYFSAYELKLYRIKYGDLLFSEGGEVGKTCFWTDGIPECYLQNSVHKLTVFKNNLSRYFLYLSCSAGSQGYYDTIVNFVSIKHLTKEKLQRVVWICPPLPEQTAIASYLDEKTALIDKKVAILEKKAEHYRTLKQSLINEAVTRGLNKQAPMKDSGVEWIGEIPGHWEVKRNKDIFIESKKKAGLNSSSYKVLSLTLKGVVVRDIESAKGKIPASFDTYQVTKRDDIVLCLFDMDVTPRIVGYVEQEGIITSAYTVIQPIAKTCMKYYFYYYLEQNRNKSLLAVSKTLRSTMTYDLFSHIQIPLPPLEEQKAIAEYLDEKTAQIDTITASIASQIATLKELRKSLINEVVTGKRKVC